MITEADIVNRPYSGEYEERIYDYESAWNSQNWTWVKFIDSDSLDWVGQFRGSPRKVAVSEKLNETIVLTSDYVFRLDNGTGDLKELEDQPQYQNLTVSPSGQFIFADYYRIEKMGLSLRDTQEIGSPIEMDMIKFLEWQGDKLDFTCDEFANWDRHLEMELDSSTWEIKIKTPHNKT